MRYMKYLAISSLLLALGSAGQAQQEDAPKPASSAMPGLVNSQNGADQDAGSGMNADKTPLTGAQQPALGSPEMRHSYWVPGLEFQNSLQSPINGVGDWTSTSYFVGTASVNVFSSHSQFALNYSGGGSVTNSSTLPNSSYQRMDVSQAFIWGRWHVSLLDQFSYLPQSSFGFGGGTNLSVPGIGGVLGSTIPGLQTSYSPGQTLFDGTGPRYTNSGVVQTDYALGSRGSLTATASYGILRFTEGNSIETNDSIFSLGYNYQVTRNDTLGLVYRFTNYRYLGDPQSLNDHVVNVAYGRKITARLGLQLFGGPDINTYRHPIGTESGRVSFSAGGVLNYAFAHSGLSLSYDHGLAGGSGVLIGSVRDNLAGRFSFPISRRLHGNTGVGYAINTPIAGSATPISAQGLHSLYASAGFDYALARTVNANLNYTFDYQDSTQTVCPAGGCGTTYTQHLIWVGLQWHARPFVLR